MVAQGAPSFQGLPSSELGAAWERVESHARRSEAGTSSVTLLKSLLRNYQPNRHLHSEGSRLCAPTPPNFSGEAGPARWLLLLLTAVGPQRKSNAIEVTQHLCCCHSRVFASLDTLEHLRNIAVNCITRCQLAFDGSKMLQAAFCHSSMGKGGVEPNMFVARRPR